MAKSYLDISVLEAARNRLDRIYADFDKVYVSFSAGKDSGVLMEMAIEAARKAGKLPVHALFIDLEAQYQETIAYAQRMLLRPEVKPYWVCLPINLRNAVSQLQPSWRCWDVDAQSAWVRPMPGLPCVINEAKAAELGWTWFEPGVEFERFIVQFAHWFSGRSGNTCTLIGIRAAESLNRYLAVARDGIEEKENWGGLNWTTRMSKHCFNAYPLYDWMPEDIWTSNGKFGWDYNRIYDLFYKAGVTMKDMRICQPYGDDQRKGLYLFQMLEHATWCRVVARVQGANYGARYAHDEAMASRGNIALPAGHSYESYAVFLLENMPAPLAAQFHSKIGKFITWWARKGVPMTDHADPRLESKKSVPSWRRVVKAILKNDYVCKSLSFGLTKADKKRQFEMLTYSRP